MKLHSNTITEADLEQAARAARLDDGQDIYISDSVTRGSRSRGAAIEFHCHSEHGRRATNSGPYGVKRKAATWTAWGYLIARLFREDPEAIIGEYKGADDFLEQCASWPGREESERSFLPLVEAVTR